MALAAVCSARASRAAEIDEATGTIHFSEGAVGVSLDGPELSAGAHLVMLDADGEPIDPGARFVDEQVPLEGTGSLAVGGDAPIAIFDLDGAVADLLDRRVEVTLWQKPMGTEARVQIVWSADMLGQVTLAPTGRATDDGWRELSSGAIDLRLAAAVGSPLVMAMDAQLGTPLERPAVLDARVHLDALEIRDLGPASVPDAACTLFDEEDVCGPSGACFYGRCADAAAVVGPNLEKKAIRAAYLERLTFLYQTFEGGRASRAAIPDLASALEALTEGAPPRAMWSTIRHAIEALGDAHASPPTTSSQPWANLGICLHLGDADMLPAGGALPMVFSTTGANPVAESLEPGDVLVSIDGVPVDEWVGAAGRLISYGGDPAAKSVTVASEILAAAVNTGAVLQFARCPSDSVPCTADEVVEVSIDLAEAIGTPTLGGAAPDWADDNALCDYRFRRFSTSSDVGSFTHAFTSEQQGVRIFEFNGFPHPTINGHTAWMNAAEDAFAVPPGRALLDERVGYGGHPAPVYRLAGYLVGESELYRVDFYPWFPGDIDPGRQSALRSCSATGFYCGGFHSDDIFSGHPAPGASAATKLAVLISMDVSGNDFFTQMLTYRAADTRFFGPAPTRGGFGEVYPLPALFGEPSGGRLQVQDSAFSAAATDAAVEFASSTGVPPHQLVLQKQSDARKGVDTIVETAMAWVQQ